MVDRDPYLWPGDILTEPNKETEAEAKLAKEIFATVTETKDNLDEVLEKNSSTSAVAEFKETTQTIYHRVQCCQRSWFKMRTC